MERITQQGFTIELPVLSIRIHDDLYPLFFPFRRWKTNAFYGRIQEEDQLFIDIRLSCSERLRVSTGKPFLQFSEGFSIYQIHDLQNEQWLFTIRQADGDLIYLQYLYDAKGNVITVTEDQTDTAGVAVIEGLVRILPALLLRADTILLHGALLESEGRGIILSAPSNVGKSTHAHLWQQQKNALILNGDLSACYQKKKNEKLVWTGFGMPWCGTSGEYINREIPVSAIVVLEQSKVNSVERLDGLNAFTALLPQLQRPTWDRQLSEKAIDLLMKMLEEIPVFRLRCRPDAESVEVLDHALRGL